VEGWEGGREGGDVWEGGRRGGRQGGEVRGTAGEWEGGEIDGREAVPWVRWGVCMVHVRAEKGR